MRLRDSFCDEQTEAEIPARLCVEPGRLSQIQRRTDSHHLIPELVSEKAREVFEPLGSTPTPPRSSASALVPHFVLGERPSSDNIVPDRQL